MAKRPYVRQWFHEGGDDTYAQKPATKTLIAKAIEARKKGHDVVIATSGSIMRSREYTPAAFLKKHPKWKIKKPAKKNQVKKRSKNKKR
ncbi:hypothetical protein FJY84_09200 [Candidatus Bathyarchaeota archaeon]|nr:hypothetical protein [Candidatus Bathyarchaeota archaeon]